MTDEPMTMHEVLVRLRGTYGPWAPHYHKLYNAVADGRVKATKRGRRYLFTEAVYETIPAVLKLPPINLAA